MATRRVQFSRSRPMRRGGFRFHSRRAAVHIPQAEGGPIASVYGHPAGPVFTLAPNAARGFAIPLPKVDGAVWRVPLTYERVDTKVEQWTEKARTTLGLARTATRRMVTNTPRSEEHT